MRTSFVSPFRFFFALSNNSSVRFGFEFRCHCCRFSFCRRFNFPIQSELATLTFC